VQYNDETGLNQRLSCPIKHSAAFLKLSEKFRAGMIQTDPTATECNFSEKLASHLGDETQQSESQRMKQL
jgi:hypothetical protein